MYAALANLLINSGRARVVAFMFGVVWWQVLEKLIVAEEHLGGAAWPGIYTLGLAASEAALYAVYGAVELNIEGFMSK